MSIKKVISSVLVLAFFFATTIFSTGYANPDSVVVKAGTPVILRLTEEVSSKTKNMNDIVSMEVARDVTIDGKIVIKAGTPANGVVTWCEKPGVVGKEGKIQFGADSTKGVDGQRVPLKASVTQMGKDNSVMSIILSVLCCFLFLFMKGKEATFPVGTEVKAYTDQDIAVNVI